LQYWRLGQKSRLRKGLVFYFTSNGITILKKHVDANQFLIAINFEEEMNINIKNLVERQPPKKKFTINQKGIFKFFGTKDLYKKDNVH
jgi:hypothetical protein